ncbi:MAG: DUF3179 domain-containing (seleno)protein, partial [Gemmatimonadota bacterium]
MRRHNAAKIPSIRASSAIGATAAVLAMVLAGAHGLVAQANDRMGPIRSEWRTDFDTFSVDPDSLYRFGPRNAIPALTDPGFETQESTSGWLGDREPVVVVSQGDETRAYPVQILML